MSEWVRGTKDPSLDQLARIADRYDLGFRKLMRAWLLDQAGRDERLCDRVQAEVFGCEADAGDPEVEHILESLRVDRSLAKAAREVVRSLDRAKVDFLRGLRPIPEMVVSGPNVRIYQDRQALPWSEITEGGRLEAHRLFVATRPAPCVVELHRIPPRTAGLHRQADLPTAPAYFECWCISAGAGILLLEDEEGNGNWSDSVAPQGAAGYYWSGTRHIWMNLSAADDLIIFHVFFPYRAPTFGEDGLGEGLDFSIDEIPISLPQSTRRAVAAVLGRFGA